MFVSISACATYLDLSESEVRKLIFNHKIKAFFDGEQYLINTSQFDTHLKEMARIRLEAQAYLSENIPESPFVKDED